MSIGLDTNILARYYIEDAGDTEAQKQRERARQLVDSGQSLVVAKTVLLEFEWVMRGYYQFSAAQVAQVVRHLMTLPHVLIEDRPAIETAIALMAADNNALDFAEALHHASYRDCEAMATFDDRRFARRAQRLGLAPRVIVPR